jgi:hypothetical protein
VNWLLPPTSVRAVVQVSSFPHRVVLSWAFSCGIGASGSVLMELPLQDWACSLMLAFGRFLVDASTEGPCLLALGRTAALSRLTAQSASDLGKGFKLVLVWLFRIMFVSSSGVDQLLLNSISHRLVLHTLMVAPFLLAVASFLYGWFSVNQ